MNGMSGDDYMDGLAGSGTYIGDWGNDTIYAGSGSVAENYVDGGGGDDVLFAKGATKNSVYGGDGNDTIRSSATGATWAYGGPERRPRRRIRRERPER
jgi:Ca2+-binding RTX toxin-like protein